MEISFEEFDPKEASKEDWEQFHHYRRIRHQEVNPDDDIMSDELIEKALQDDNPMAKSTRVAVKKDNSIVGMISVGFLKEGTESYENNKHLAQVSASLHPDLRNQGYGYHILRKTYDIVNAEGKELIITSTSEEDGKRFFEKINAQIALAGAENRLKIENVNWEMVENWVHESEEKNPTTTLKSFSKIPDDIIDEYANLYTQVNNQQPLDDLDVNDIIFTPDIIRTREKKMEMMGVKTLTIITQEEDDTISGLTEVYNPPDNKKINQGLTGVSFDQRGRGLGKWLKAAMLLKIREDFPDTRVISTDNANTNAPMRSINERLGFEKHKALANAQIKMTELRELLKKKEILPTNQI